MVNGQTIQTSPQYPQPAFVQEGYLTYGSIVVVLAIAVGAWKLHGNLMQRVDALFEKHHKALNDTVTALATEVKRNDERQQERDNNTNRRIDDIMTMLAQNARKGD